MAAARGREGARAPRRRVAAKLDWRRARGRFGKSCEASRPPRRPMRTAGRSAWIAFGDECQTRRTFAHANVPLACYFVKAFDPSWLDVNHRPRYAACNSCGGWRDLGENPNAAAGGTAVRRIRKSRTDGAGDDGEIEHDGFDTELDARRAASRGRLRWPAWGGIRVPTGVPGCPGVLRPTVTCTPRPANSRAPPRSACRVRSSPPFDPGRAARGGRPRHVAEPVDARGGGDGARAIAGREGGDWSRSPAPSGASWSDGGRGGGG